MLLIIGEGGTIPIRDEAILAVMNENMPVALGWLFAIIVVGGLAAASLLQIRARKREGLPAAGDVGLGRQDRPRSGPRLRRRVPAQPGAPARDGEDRHPGRAVGRPAGRGARRGAARSCSARTGFGRHVYAVGGNAEAARRAGINVANIKTICFVLCSTLAVVAGILLASRDNSVSPTTGGAQTLLYAVGAAVIGGTSLFGGRGRIYDAVTGGLVVAVIANGLPLVTQKSGTQFIINGIVLLVAASVDAISRRRAAATGR